MNEREQIHFLAAILRVQNVGAMTVQECIDLAEATLMDVQFTDARTQERLAAEEKAAQPPAPVTDKVQ